jgi:hypothetical protein
MSNIELYLKPPSVVFAVILFSIIIACIHVTSHNDCLKPSHYLYRNPVTHGYTVQVGDIRRGGLM